MDQKSRQSSETGFPKGSIGDLSMRLGQDVRELIIDGYTWEQIFEMIREREAKENDERRTE